MYTKLSKGGSTVSYHEHPQLQTSNVMPKLQAIELCSYKHIIVHRPPDHQIPFSHSGGQWWVQVGLWSEISKDHTHNSHWFPLVWQWSLDAFSSDVHQVFLGHRVQVKDLAVLQNLCGNVQEIAKRKSLVNAINVTMATDCAKPNNLNSLGFTFFCRFIVFIVVFFQYVLLVHSIDKVHGDRYYAALSLLILTRKPQNVFIVPNKAHCFGHTHFEMRMLSKPNVRKFKVNAT